MIHLCIMIIHIFFPFLMFLDCNVHVHVIIFVNGHWQNLICQILKKNPFIWINLVQSSRRTLRPTSVRDWVGFRDIRIVCIGLLLIKRRNNRRLNCRYSFYDYSFTNDPCVTSVYFQGPHI